MYQLHHPYSRTQHCDSFSFSLLVKWQGKAVPSEVDPQLQIGCGNLGKSATTTEVAGTGE